MRRLLYCLIFAAYIGAAGLPAQTPIYVPPTPPEPQKQEPAPPPAPPQAQPRPAQPQAAQPQPAQPQPAQAQPGQPPSPAPAAPATAQQTQPQTAPPRLSDNAPFQLIDAQLTEAIRILASRLKINYILDPSVRGSITLYTYGEVKAVDEMPLLQTILRMNGFAMVQVGDLYRIVPIKMVSQLPLSPTANADGKTLPDDERMILNLVFLKYASSAEMSKLLLPFLGEGAQITSYDAANLLIVEDNSRSMKRTMELIAMFDSDTLAGQRVKLFDVVNSRPSDLVKELESVFKAYALSDKGGAVRFIPVDRINTLIAVAPNPGIFTQVKSWIEKLDIAVVAPAGSTDLYYYRLKYGRAETVALAITAVLTGNPMAMIGLAQAYSGGMGMGGGFGSGGYGASGYGGAGYGGAGYGGAGYGSNMGYGGAAYGGAYGGAGYGGMGYGGGYNGYGYNSQSAASAAASTPPVATPSGSNANPIPAPGANPDLTGAYMGLAAASGAAGTRGPSVIPNPFDNTLLVRSTAQEWAQIQKLLRQIDVPPRQVLIDAKIYELELNGAYTAGLQSYLEKKDTASRKLSANITNTAGAASASLSEGLLVGHALELLGQLNLAESTHNAKVISSPSIVATDSVPAVMNVGQDVPVLTSQGVVGGVSQSGTNVFGSTVSNRSTGTTLSITARINSSGIVTMLIDQDVSSPLGSTSGAIASPSFSRRSFSTQVTVQDGDTIAIGGFIQEQNSNDSSGLPVLHRIPLLGALFGAKSMTKARTELIVFLTPRVIYDTNQLTDATDEIKDNMKKMQKMMREQ